jgi:HPt (histidine-containing phosphotransfer) domain-containing protein
MTTRPGEPVPDILRSALLREDPGLADIVEEFVAGLPGRIAELRTAHASHDWQHLKTLAHRLKGAGGSYGYPQISALGAAMECAIRTRHVEEFAHCAQQLERLAAAARAGLAG